MKYTQAIGSVEVERWSAVVLYDPRSGDIIHLHQCISLKGGEHPSRARLELDAREGLRRVAAGRPIPRRLLPLRVDPRTLDTEYHYRVDPRKRALVKTPARQLLRRRRARKGQSAGSRR
jgi:hypothetical protein